MDELEKGEAISVKGAAREVALRDCRAQMDAWRVALPPVEPLVLDFGLGEFRKTGLIEYWIANEAAAGYCGKYLFVFDGQTCPLHRHGAKHETFFVVKGRVRMSHDNRTIEMGEGDVLPVRPGGRHSFTGIGPALLLELSTPCEIEDNDFADERIRIGR
jgi:mannose-6-phosphate isomerase-like protein (cupin superfamily)